MQRTGWRNGARMVRGLTLVGLMLAGSLARAQDGQVGGAGAGGLLALLEHTQVNQSQTVEASHAQVCDELSRAGQTLRLIAWDRRGRVTQVFHDVGRGHYVSVSSVGEGGASPTQIRISAGMPSLWGSSLSAE